MQAISDMRYLRFTGILYLIVSKEFFTFSDSDFIYQSSSFSFHRPIFPLNISYLFVFLASNQEEIVQAINRPDAKIQRFGPPS